MKAANQSPVIIIDDQLTNQWNSMKNFKTKLEFQENILPNFKIH